MIQFDHGKVLVALLALKKGGHVLDIGAGYDEAMPVTELRDQIGSAIERALATANPLKSLSKVTKVAFIRQLRG